MLRRLIVHNIVLIEQLNVEFKEGLCVLTGETGAGKSILMDALMFALGSRASQKLLRHGADKGSVVAEFAVCKGAPVCEFLDEQAIFYEDELVLRRVIDGNGKSKAYINDTPVTQQLLSQCGELLVEIHGQHDQRNLFSAQYHRQWLDQYGQLLDIKKQMQEAYDHYLDAKSDYESFEQKAQSVEQERDYLQHALDELSTWSLGAEVEAELSQKRSRLLNSEKFLTVVAQARDILSGASIGDAISSSSSLLLKNSELDNSFPKIVEVLERADIEIREAEHMIEMLGQSVEEEEGDLEQIEEHLFALRAMARKYQVEVADLPEQLVLTKEKLGQLENYQDTLVSKKADLDAHKRRYCDIAQNLGAMRQQAAKKLEVQLQQELAPLKMERTTLSVGIIALPEEQWSREGMERVEFLVSTNPGAPLGPLTKIASGGELSRFMLALKVVLQQNNAISTMIFDEVDTGIGGAVADAVGKRLYRLANKAQLLIITHQPQVAAYGNHHYKVVKTHQEAHTVTNVVELVSDQRRDELARMLSGAEVTGEARAAADKLLESLCA
jgi:DNA repair protein RecN (Recombination protein N)